MFFCTSFSLIASIRCQQTRVGWVSSDVWCLQRREAGVVGCGGGVRKTQTIRICGLRKHVRVVLRVLWCVVGVFARFERSRSHRVYLPLQCSHLAVNARNPSGTLEPLCYQQESLQRCTTRMIVCISNIYIMRYRSRRIQMKTVCWRLWCQRVLL